MSFKKRKAIFNWSGGKDSALALHHVLNSGDYNIHRLITTVNERYDRISMHGVRTKLLNAQSASLMIPLQRIYLPEMPSMSIYDDIMTKTLLDFKNEGITHSIFGDIFLEDLKEYRDQKLSTVGLKGHYPLWKRDTRELLHEFIDLGFKTILVCVDSSKLPQEFVGQVIDHDFLKELPEGVDPCGENGEFHTFVFDGPIFTKPIPYTKGEIVYKEYRSPNSNEDLCGQDNTDKSAGFYFQDLLLK